MITLIQPRSPWGLQPYLPNGLLAVAARLQAVGKRWHIIDENLGQELWDFVENIYTSHAIGIGCLGPPYVSETLRVAHEVRRMVPNTPILIGGELIKKLSPQQFKRIFAGLSPVFAAGNEEDLDGFFKQKLPSIFDISMGPVIRALPPAMRKAYFAKEWCLFTSQGCKFNCNFCAASKAMREQFRKIEAFRDEVEALASAVDEATGGNPQYEVYCSSLDGFQNPLQMEALLREVAEASRVRGFTLKLRFLATAKCTVQAEERNPGIIARFCELGVKCVGIGVDGNDIVTWKRENKAHNDASTIRQALDLLAKNQIQPEAFMVIGLPGDSWQAVLRGGMASLRYAQQGIRPRPYLGKVGTPGTKAWTDEAKIVETLLKNPTLMREFDYGGLASPITHPNTPMRWFTNVVYMTTCLGLKATRVGCPTQPLLPSESVSPPLRHLARWWNRHMPQDR
jgi:hypothetical protein